MNHILNVSLAQRLGIHAALILRYIRDEVWENQSNGVHYYTGRYWMRCSQMMFTAAMPYMHKSTVRRVLERLMNQGIIMRGEFGSSRFDRTSWYALTQYGERLMTGSEDY